MTGPLDPVLRRLRTGAPLLLDGATGTELERRGLDCGLPLWSARALLEHPEAVAEIHAAYVAAGADAITANTFRTQRRTLARAGLGDRAADLTGQAVALARAAAADPPVAVLGSAPPLEDCFRPDRVPDDAALAREHAEHAEHLARAGVDALLIETICSAREARAALAAARAVGLPALVGFVCWHGARLLSGEPLAEALAVAADGGAVAAGVNCLPLANVAACLPDLAASGLPALLYANLDQPYANLDQPLDGSGDARSEPCDPPGFAAHAAAWVAEGVRMVGGCCGTTPDHVAALAQRLRGVEGPG
jgi:S-methylmethionine-dependent homocysteine/selenocysteine methylase